MRSVLSFVLLVGTIISLPGYTLSQVTLTVYGDDSIFTSTDSDTISASTGVSAIGTAADGSETTFLYHEVDIVTGQVSGVATTTTGTIDATLINSASGFKLSISTNIPVPSASDTVIAFDVIGCDSTGENSGVCSQIGIVEDRTMTTTVVQSTQSGSASTVVLGALSSATGNKSAASSIGTGSALGMLGIVVVGIFSGVLIL
ncbi:hypothetical protein K435DRAFT_855887 [Dendrothele bispora CBS 962.96]|uniref:Uncharacterized protein n=1 Tax=Dendrothele bispora (strain CBS 962.96) TaxID=1314807 RepID=A0A4S8M9X1_DENBC|nr:hypothetical protein K435DRAFT_855887 [Dendrothele bispora CBS 962.96]